jgi:small multidrug resistance pump
MNAYSLLVFGAALSFTIGGVFMKTSDGLTQPWPTAMLLVCFAIGAVLQTLAMRGEALGTTYVVVLGAEAVLACWLGWSVFGERLTTLQLAGIIAILIGIAAVRS